MPGVLFRVRGDGDGDGAAGGGDDRAGDDGDCDEPRAW